MRRVLIVVVILVGLALASLYVIGRGWLGHVITAGAIEGEALAPSEVSKRDELVHTAAESLGVNSEEQILFGDLHVHSGFSLDAYVGSLPLAGGSGAYTVADACDFLFCLSSFAKSGE